MTDDELRKAHRHCFNNGEEVERSKLAGCFYCESVFDPHEEPPHKSAANETTQFCPRCHIDSVIGDASGYDPTPEFLKEMHHHWFEYGYDSEGNLVETR